jgi:NYN domain/OST-HTH/LOTUS domain
MDILHAGKVDGFVLVSSDSDFTRLASRIREDGLQVIGVGEKKTPESLRNVCNRFIFLENIAAPGEPAPDAPTPDAPTPAKPANTPAKAEKDPPSKAIPLVLAAMKKIGIEEDAYPLGQLGQVLTQLHPDFDSRSYGSARLSDLLKRTGRFDVQKGDGNQLMVRDKA